MPTDKELIYVIADPKHSLGFLVVSPYEPVGYTDPFLLLTDLERMRKDKKRHLKLYCVKPVPGPIVSQKELEKYLKNRGVKDFQYSLVREYLS